MANKVDTSHAIATAYRNFEFRSRLEAKYAIFFDACGWKWSYEPFDLPGWIPDFSIGYLPTLVEVKPFFHEGDFDEAKRKIVASGYTGDVVLLGADPTWRNDDTSSEGPPFGWLFQNVANDGELPQRVTWELHFGITEGNGKLGLCPMQGGWSNVIWDSPPLSEFCTHPNKWSRVWMQDRHEIEQFLISNWAHACNVSKWVPINENRKGSRHTA